MLNRRKYIGASTTVGVAGALSAHIGFAQTPATQTTGGGIGAKIGDPPDVFEAALGPGQVDGNWTVYGSPDSGDAVYHVFFNDKSQAETVFIDFQGMENGGLPMEVESMGTSRFLWDDAEAMNQLAIVGAVGETDDIRYLVQPWSSPSLADTTGRSGNVIVIDAFLDSIETENPPILYTFVTMEAAEVNTLSPAGTLPGPLSAREEWAEYAEIPEDEMTPIVFEGGPAQGEWTVSGSAITGVIQPLPAAETNTIVGHMMPTGELAWTTVIGRPGDSTLIRLHGVNTGEQGEVAPVGAVSAQIVSGTEAEGEVNAIKMGAVYQGFEPPSF